jgi:hypothetical protein
MSYPPTNRPVLTELYLPVRFLKSLPPLSRDAARNQYGHRIQALQMGTHKLIRRSNGQQELYDIASDPEEMVDRSEDDPERVAALASELDGMLDRYKRSDTEAPAAVPEPSGKAREMLRALGYLE